jgi:hypothetical protein
MDPLKQYLADKYGRDAILQQQINNAQTTANQNKFGAEMGQAFNTIGSALGTPGQKPDQTFYQNQIAQSDKPMQNLLAADKLQSSGNNAVAQYLLHKNNLDLAQQKQKSLEDYRSKKLQIEGGKTSKKDDDAQSKADAELGAKILTAGGRGVNASYEQTIKRGQQVQALLNQYPDLNKMPQKQVALLTQEIDGLINGGAPTIAATTEMGINTPKSTWNELMGKANNAPTGADLGPYIKEIIPYVNDVVANSMKHQRKVRSHLIESKKSQLSGDAYDRYQSEMEEDYPMSSPQQQDQQPQKPPQPIAPEQAANPQLPPGMKMFHNKKTGQVVYSMEMPK